MMDLDPAIAFAPRSEEDDGLEIRVNFGIFAGREATPAEIDELAKALVPEVGEVTIVSEQRHEVSAAVEALLHQVRVEVEPEQVPADRDERDALANRLLAACDLWARICIAERHVDV